MSTNLTLRFMPFALSSVGALLLALCYTVEAQQPKSNFRLGFLSRDIQPADSRGPVHHRLEAFREGMRELGYAEGKNLVIEYRYADGRLERLPALAQDLVRLKLDVIVTDTRHQLAPPRKRPRRFQS